MKVRLYQEIDARVLPELKLGNVGNYAGRGLMLNISLPNQIIDFIERQAISDDFNTPSEYVFHIMLREQERNGTYSEYRGTAHRSDFC